MGAQAQAPLHLTTFGCGAGTQSTAIYFMMRDGKIPLPDAAIFADTGAEPAEVYDNVEFLKAGFEELGVPFYIVGRGPDPDIMRDVLDRRVYATIPAFTVIERTVRVPLWWNRCTCDWARVFGIGGEKGVKALGDFAPGVTREQLLRHDEYHNGADDCEICFSGNGEDGARGSDSHAGLMLDETGLPAVPMPCAECHSEGRIPTRWHTYTKVEKGRIKRECTGKYKVEPIEKKIRELLGATIRHVPCKFCLGVGERLAPWDIEAGWGPCSVCFGTGTRRLVGRAPKGSTVQHIIGFSEDEALDRPTTQGFRKYMTPIHPLITLGVTRDDCERLIIANGRRPVKSACLPCPFHGNAYWRHLRDNFPDEWQRVVAYDYAIREVRGSGLKGKRYLHFDCVPLDQANLDKPSKVELAEAQGDLYALLLLRENGSDAGCSPYACRGGTGDATPTVDLGLPGIVHVA